MNEKIGKLLPVAGLVVASALVVVLALKVRDLNERYAEAFRRARDPYAGMFVPTFQATTHTGEPVTVGEVEGEGRQVLFFFTTTCPYCRSTLPAWREIVAAVDTISSVPVKVYGISLDSAEVTRKYVEEHRLPFPVLHFPQEKLSSLYRARAVPLTAVVDAQGRMIHARLGELTERAAIDSVVAMAQWKPVQPPAQSAGTQATGTQAATR